MEKAYTACKTCKRVIYIEHADKDGNCSEHGKPVMLEPGERVLTAAQSAELEIKK